MPGPMDLPAGGPSLFLGAAKVAGSRRKRDRRVSRKGGPLRPAREPLGGSPPGGRGARGGQKALKARQKRHQRVFVAGRPGGEGGPQGRDSKNPRV